jgi:hypothetical protein
LVYIALSLITALSALAPKFSLREPLADRKQFAPAYCARFWKGHFESFECIENNSGYDQPSILLVVGGNDMPGRVPALLGTEWWPMIAFVVFKSPAEGRTHIFRPGEPMLQILIVPVTSDFTLVPMEEEAGSFVATADGHGGTHIMKVQQTHR